ncbi:MAG: LysR family transcriptional regulator [Rhodospirillaceae bacterium]|nr:LysR family transcriptional regulator [Rhodospirillaceae bacterium]
MNFVQLRAFHAVANHGSFSAAAQFLGVSQPAVTVQIKALEETLGARLFHRGGSTVELTDYGRELLPDAQKIAKILETIEARFSASRTVKSGYLSIGACAPYLLVPLLRRFCTQHPGVRLDVRLGNSRTLIEDVLTHQIDLAVATLKAPREDLACLKLVTQRVLVLVPAGHPWDGRPAVPVADLEGESFVLREEGSMTRALFEDGLAAAGVRVHLALELQSREAVKEAVAGGLGLGIVLDHELGSDPRIAGIPVEGADMSAGEYLTALPDYAGLGTVKAFIDLARIEYADAP